jgi:2-amino-4-hydroxy-6-hydroxymethyldihydropteridine diphosphokinase
MSRRKNWGKPTAMTTAAIALGSNLGDRKQNLREAAERLGEHGQVIQASRLYETAPMYVTDQPPFLNAALLLETELGPEQLLLALKSIERTIGRQPALKNGPREIDLDLIAYGRLRYRFEADGEVRLHVPHPLTPERRFVLAPLSEIAPDLELPGLGRVDRLLAATDQQASAVTVLTDALLPVLRAR